VELGVKVHLRRFVIIAVRIRVAKLSRILKGPWAILLLNHWCPTILSIFWVNSWLGLVELLRIFPLRKEYIWDRNRVIWRMTIKIGWLLFWSFFGVQGDLVVNVGAWSHFRTKFWIAFGKIILWLWVNFFWRLFTHLCWFLVLGLFTGHYYK